ncbi:hypothetical protein [Azospirillum endophyticum]
MSISGNPTTALHALQRSKGGVKWGIMTLQPRPQDRPKSWNRCGMRCRRALQPQASATFP